MQPYHLVVVDDAIDVREMLAEYLTKQGFIVHTAGDGAELRTIMAQQPVSMVLLDVHLPDEDGLTLARMLCTQYTVGIIMLTAANDVSDRVVGLELGADDYLAKPFDLREVVARIHSVLRRRLGLSMSCPASPPSEALQRIGQCLLDEKTHSLQTLAGEPIPLTAMEFALLQTLASHPERVLSREQLLELAHDRDWTPDDRSLDIRIARLRRKIEANPKKPQVIKTVYGEGYMFVPSYAA